MKIRKGIVLNIFLVSVYFFLFNYVYKFQIVPYYEYMGLTYNSNSLIYISFLFSIFPIFWLPDRIKKPSSITFWFLYLFLIFPINQIIFLVSKSSNSFDQVLFLLYINFLFYFSYFLTTKTGYVRLLHTKYKFELFKYQIPVLTFLISMIVFYVGGFKIDLSIDTIYDRRLAARDIKSSFFLFGYLEGLLYGVFMPLLFVYSIINKNKLNILIIVFSIVAIFSLKGSKGVVFSPFFLLSVYLIVSKGYKFGKAILTLFILLLFISLIELFLFDTSLLAAYVIRRKLVIPSQLTVYYWEFFSNNPFVYMKDSIIGDLLPFDSNYTMRRSYLIGETYFKDGHNANANIWAVAFADFGYIGMFITTIICSYILKILDRLGKSHFILSCCSCAYIGVVWSEGGLYSSFLTNGLLFILLVLWIQKIEKKVVT